jgi:glutaredoxin
MSQEKRLVIIYTRPGCHLCEEAKSQILAARCADLYELEEINIETDPALVERYGVKIPVITINGVEAFKYNLTSAKFREALAMLTTE